MTVCFFFPQLTGGTYINGVSGVVTSDTISIALAGSSNPPQKQLVMKHAVFGCAQSYISTSMSNTQQRTAISACPPLQQYVAPMRGQGIEFGFTFTPMSFATQLFSRGAIERVLGLCYQPPRSPTSCTSTTNPTNSYIFMGRAPAPTSTAALEKTTSIPLLLWPWSLFTGANGTSGLSTLEFRSYVASFSVPTFGASSATPTVVKMPSNTAVLWDSGAYGMMAVGPGVRGCHVMLCYAMLWSIF